MSLDTKCKEIEKLLHKEFLNTKCVIRFWANVIALILTYKFEYTILFYILIGLTIINIIGWVRKSIKLDDNDSEGINK